MTSSKFERNVFINCPFDKDYQPILRPILFCVIRAGLVPRLATERQDGGESRLDKICTLIRDSKYSIHDLSRCQAIKRGEISRMNMPFELGIDYGLRRMGTTTMRTKCFLVMDEQPFRLKQAMSDINGWDTQAHAGDPQNALSNVRNWLCLEAASTLPGGETLYSQYLHFEEWKYARPDHTRADIESYKDFELISEMRKWDSEQPEAGKTMP